MFVDPFEEAEVKVSLCACSTIVSTVHPFGSSLLL